MSVDPTRSGPPVPRPDANLGYLFRLAYQRFHGLLEDQLEEKGLTVQEYAILSVFETRAELSTSELARISQVTRQTMHSAIVRLESAGLLERKARNQRVVRLRPTKQGRDVLRSATRHVRAAERAALEGLTANDQATVRAWLAGVAGMNMRPAEAGADRREKP